MIDSFIQGELIRIIISVRDVKVPIGDASVIGVNVDNRTAKPDVIIHAIAFLHIAPKQLFCFFLFLFRQGIDEIANGISPNKE